MDELEFDGKKYLSSKRAAELTGYAKDYVGQLCREGRVEARLVGRAWYVSEDSIREHRFGEEEKASEQGVEEVVPEVLPEEEPQTSWNTASYSTEVIDVIPTLVSRPTFVPEVRPVEEKTSPVDHMQSVWQDWFTKDSGEAAEESKPSEVMITRIAEEPVREEAVPIYRIPTHEPAAPIPAPVVEERKVRPLRRERKQIQSKNEAGSFVVQALLIALILVAGSITFVSLGYGLNIPAVGQNPVIEYISGISK